MVQERQAGQDYFRTLLRTVVGQAFAAAGYHFQETPLQWAGGKYRFLKTMDDGFFGIIDFQVLVYSDTMWSAGAPSRFRVQVTRATERDGKALWLRWLRDARTESTGGDRFRRGYFARGRSLVGPTAIRILLARRWRRLGT